MLCPECLKKKIENKMKVTDSRAQGPFETWRKYQCGDCGFITYNTEKLEDPVCQTVEVEN